MNILQEKFVNSILRNSFCGWASSLSGGCRSVDFITGVPVISLAVKVAEDFWRLHVNEQHYILLNTIFEDEKRKFSKIFG